MMEEYSPFKPRFPVPAVLHVFKQTKFCKYVKFICLIENQTGK
jgi:hypothetical protein